MFDKKLPIIGTDFKAAAVSEDFDKIKWMQKLEAYGLTTAKILYHMPDHKSLLQEYLWQNYDLAPKFPELKKFLDFWKKELDGPLHSVTVSHSGLIRPQEFKHAGAEFSLN